MIFSRSHGLRMLLAVTAAIGAGQGLAASIEDAFEQDWFEIEFFVFERTEVMEHTIDEQLVLTEPRQLPWRMLAALPGAEGYEGHYEVDALTKLCLDYPTLVVRSDRDGVATMDSGLGSGPDAAPSESGVAGAAAAETVASDAEVFKADSPVVTGDATVDPTLSVQDTPEDPDEREQLRAAIAAFEQELYAGALQWLPAESLQLHNEVRSLERSGSARVLFHGRWRQPVPERSLPSPLLLQAGQSLVPMRSTPELVGTVGVTLGRYLHFKAELFYQAPALGGAPISIAYDGVGRRHEITPFPRPETDEGYMKLSESRRMRSTELHYLDHPKLGVVVRIDPVVLPDSLIEAFDSLEEPL